MEQLQLREHLNKGKVLAKRKRIIVCDSFCSVSFINLFAQLEIRYEKLFNLQCLQTIFVQFNKVIFLLVRDWISFAGTSL